MAVSGTKKEKKSFFWGSKKKKAATTSAVPVKAVETPDPFKEAPRKQAVPDQRPLSPRRLPSVNPPRTISFEKGKSVESGITNFGSLFFDLESPNSEAGKQSVKSNSLQEVKPPLETSHSQRIADLKQQRGEREAQLKKKFESLRDESANASVTSKRSTQTAKKKATVGRIRARPGDPLDAGSFSGNVAGDASIGPTSVASRKTTQSTKKKVPPSVGARKAGESLTGVSVSRSISGDASVNSKKSTRSVKRNTPTGSFRRSAQTLAGGSVSGDIPGDASIERATSVSSRPTSKIKKGGQSRVERRLGDSQNGSSSVLEFAEETSASASMPAVSSFSSMEKRAKGANAKLSGRYGNSLTGDISEDTTVSLTATGHTPLGAPVTVRKPRDDSLSNSHTLGVLPEDKTYASSPSNSRKKKRIVRVIRRRRADSSQTGSSSLTSSHSVVSRVGSSDLEKKLRISEKKVNQLRIILSKSDAIINKLSSTKKQLLAEKANSASAGPKAAELENLLDNERKENEKLRCQLVVLKKQLDSMKNDEKAKTQEHQDQLATLQRDWFEMEQKVEDQARLIQKQKAERDDKVNQLESENLDMVEKIRDKELEMEVLQEQLEDALQKLRDRPSAIDQLSEMESAMRQRETSTQALQKQLGLLQELIRKKSEERNLLIESHKKESSELHQALQEKEAESQLLRNELRVLQESTVDLDAIRKKLCMAEEELKTTSDQLERLRKESTEKDTALTATRQSCADLEQVVVECKTEISTLHDQLAKALAEAERETESNQTRVKEYEEKAFHAELEKERMQGVFSDLQEQMEFTDKRNIDLLKKLKEQGSKKASQVAAQLEAEKALLQKSLDESKENLQKSTEKIETLQKVVRMQEAEAEEADEQAKAAMKANDRLQQLEVENSTTTVKFENYEKRIHILSEENVSLKTNLANSQESLELAHDTLDVLEKQLEQLEKAGEQNMCLEAEKRKLQEDIENLQKHAKLNVTLRSNLVNTQAELKAAMETIALLEQEAAAAEQVNNEKLIQAQNIATQMQVRVGGLQSQIQAKESENVSLTSEIASHQDNLKKSHDTIWALEQRVAQAESSRLQEVDKLRQIELEAQKHQNQLQTINEQTQNIVAENESLRSNLSSSQDSLSLAHSTIDKLENHLKQADESYIQSEMKFRKAELECQKYFSENEKLRSLNESATSENAMLRSKIASHQNDLDMTRDAVDELERSLANAMEDKNDLETRLQRYGRSNGGLEIEIERLRSDAKVMRAENATLRTEAAKHQTNLDSVNDTLRILEAESEQVDEMERELRETKVKLRRSERDYEALQERHSKSLSSAVGGGGEYQQRLEEANREIQALEKQASRFHRAETSLVKHRSKIVSLEEELIKTRTQVAEMDFDAEDAEERLREANEEIDSLERKAERLNRAERLLKEQRESIQSLERELSGFSSQGF